MVGGGGKWWAPEPSAGWWVCFGVSGGSASESSAGCWRHGGSTQESSGGFGVVGGIFIFGAGMSFLLVLVLVASLALHHCLLLLALLVLLATFLVC